MKLLYLLCLFLLGMAGNVNIFFSNLKKLTILVDSHKHQKILLLLFYELADGRFPPHHRGPRQVTFKQLLFQILGNIMRPKK
jgi:hypothetical protein